MEAILEDERQENFDNAEAGLILAKYVHTTKHDNRTGSGPCQLSSNNNFLECAQPLPVHWDDLYSTWNLAFVSSFSDFVNYIPKLLIPSVSGYQKNPESYIMIRARALYIFIHWNLNWADYRDTNNIPKIQWNDASLTKDWGVANKISKQDYVRKLASALKTSSGEIESKPRPSFPLNLKQFVWDSIWLPVLRRGPYNILA